MQMLSLMMSVIVPTFIYLIIHFVTFQEIQIYNIVYIVNDDNECNN